MSRMDDFERDVEKLVNCQSFDNECNTPDFVLAKYLRECLESFMDAANARDRLRSEPAKASAPPTPDRPPRREPEA